MDGAARCLAVDGIVPAMISIAFMVGGGEAPLGPIVVGGLGGSGTRVVACILQELATDLGPHLNKQLDNLWFTALFKRPEWIQRQKERGGEPIRVLLRLLARALGDGLDGKLPPQEAALLAEAREDILAGRAGSGARVSALDTLCQAAGSQANRWGWKEPNSHIVLDELIDAIPRPRYIHVVRHGLDMALSNNTQQARNWGALYGLTPIPSEARVPPRFAFEYWKRSNERAITLARQRLGAGLLVVRFEKLCAEPVSQIQRIADWASLPLSPDTLDRLATIPVLPHSSGRYKSMPLWRLSDSDRDALSRFEYSFRDADADISTFTDSSS